MERIAYKAGYKYQLAEDYVVSIGIKPDHPIKTGYIGLTVDGVLVIKEGYAWDGPSGPTIDTLNFMRGSLVHDALYQLMRERHLNRVKYREAVDRLLQKMLREDRMSALRAWWVYHGVRLGGGPSADPAHNKVVIRAPKKCQTGGKR